MELKFPGAENQRTDINRFFAATVAGALSTAFLYTIFGFIFCHVHAGKITSEMALFAANNLTPVIKPDDIILSSLIHQFGAGSFFGLTLGLLIGIAGAVAGSVLWFFVKETKLHNLILAFFSVVIATFACISGYSRELPAVSILFGILSPFAFFLPWLLIVKNRKPKKIPSLSWIIFILIICTPLILLKSQSYELIRDVMADTPVLNSINNFYYEHTLLAADVIKPVRFRTQNAVAVSDNIKEITGLPNGSLFIITKDPCSLKGAVIVASADNLPCDHARISGSSEIISADSILNNDYGDPNKILRTGIGTFLKGPILVVPLVIFGWASFGMACLYRKKPWLAVIITVCYIAAFAPAFYQHYLKNSLYSNPSKIHEYVSSANLSKRYLTLIYMLDKNVEQTDGLYPDELKSLVSDKKAATRLNALVFAGNLKNMEFFDMIKASLTDPQLNVRTKAVWALGRLGSNDTIQILENVLKNDPSWYVRDYSYNALAKLKPQSLVIRK